MDRGQHFNVNQSLRSLRKLVIHESAVHKMEAAWIESVRLSAPPGLEVVIKEEDL